MHGRATHDIQASRACMHAIRRLVGLVVAGTGKRPGQRSSKGSSTALTSWMVRELRLLRSGCSQANRSLHARAILLCIAADRIAWAAAGVLSPNASTCTRRFDLFTPPSAIGSLRRLLFCLGRHACGSLCRRCKRTRRRMRVALRWSRRRASSRCCCGGTIRVSAAREIQCSAAVFTCRGHVDTVRRAVGLRAHAFACVVHGGGS